MSQPDSVHVVSRNWRGKPVQFSAEARQAMVLLEGLINVGDLELVSDQYMGNRLMFRPAYRAPVVETITAAQGEVVGFSLDPLEQAIDQAVRLVAEAEGELAVKLSRHLDALLLEQLKRVQAHE
mgnify:CR=1 FL=1